MEAPVYEVANFDEDVLAASRRRPVLVDFWAPWCGPCRALGPVLERLAAEPEAAWTLVKVNTDVHAEVSARYGVRGIPNVMLFVDGEVTDGFTGALPEYAVRQWLDKALPTPAKATFAEARRALDGENPERAEALLEETLAGEPSHAEASVLLASLIAFRDPERAAALVDGAAFAGPGHLQTQDAVRTVARLLRLAGEPGTLPDGPARDDYRAALDAVARGEFGAALERFIAVIRQDRYYDDDGARKACIALFHLLGPQHEAVRAWRRRFDMALY